MPTARLALLLTAALVMAPLANANAGTGAGGSTSSTVSRTSGRSGASAIARAIRTRSVLRRNGAVTRRSPIAGVRAAGQRALRGTRARTSALRDGLQTAWIRNVLDPMSARQPSAVREVPVENLDHLQLGTALGQGWEKDVFALANDPDHVIALPRDTSPEALGRLRFEAEALDLLHNAGFPVVRMQVGTFQGRPAAVYERLRFFSRATWFRRTGSLRQELGPLLTPEALQGLHDLSAISRRTGVSALDFQWGLTGDPARPVVIADPRAMLQGGMVGRVSQAVMLGTLAHDQRRLESVARRTSHPQ